MPDKPSKFSYDLALALNDAAAPVFFTVGRVSNSEIIEGFGLAIGAYIGTCMATVPASFDVSKAMALHLDALRASAEAAAVNFIESHKAKAAGSQEVH